MLWVSSPCRVAVTRRRNRLTRSCATALGGDSCNPITHRPKELGGLSPTRPRVREAPKLGDFTQLQECFHPISHSPLEAVLLEPIAQRVPCDPQPLRGARLISLLVFERLFDQRPLP